MSVDIPKAPLPDEMPDYLARICTIREIAADQGRGRESDVDKRRIVRVSSVFAAAGLLMLIASVVIRIFILGSFTANAIPASVLFGCGAWL